MLKKQMYTTINAAAIKGNLMRPATGGDLGDIYCKENGGNRSTTTRNNQKGKKMGGRNY